MAEEVTFYRVYISVGEAWRPLGCFLAQLPKVNTHTQAVKLWLLGTNFFSLSIQMKE